jgi:hypothetical protein
MIKAVHPLAAKVIRFILLFALLCVGTQGFAAQIYRKQSGTAAIPTGTSTTVTIQSVNRAKSFMIFSLIVDANTPSIALVGGEITNSTTLTFTRDAGNNPVTIKWEVFEFTSGVTVQHGSTGNVGNPTNVAITSVNTAKTFVIATSRNDGAAFGNDDSFTANLTSATQLQLSAPGSGVTMVYWQVVQYDDSNVQKVTGTITAPATSATSVITAVNLAKTMVISNHTISADIAARDLPLTELASTTSVSYTRTGTTGTMNFVTYVVTFTDQTTVTRGSATFSAGATTQNVAVTASLTGSTVFSSGNQMRQGSTDFTSSGGAGTNDNVGHTWFNFEVTKPLNLTITRATGTTDGTSNAVATWQLVTFENEVRTYYSLATGSWDSNTSWSLSSDGSSGALPVGEWPSRVDNVVIRSGHDITVNNVADNYYPGVKPDDLGKANIGNSFESSNLAMFYHTGNILVTGTWTITGGVKAMVGGYTKVTGTLTTGSTLVNTGSLEAESGSTLATLDDLILTGNSITVINTNSTSSDDLIIDHTDATLCGTGTTQLQNGGGSEITFVNGGTISQVCTSFTITCSGGGGGGCPVTFPTVGTTTIVVGNTGPGGVGNTLGTSQLKLWFRIDNGVNTTGATVNSWTNSAGVAALDIAETGTERPTLVANALNGFSEVSFNGANRLRTGLTLTAANFVVDRASTFSVIRADNTTQQTCVYVTDPLDINRFSNHLPWQGVAYFDIGTCCGTDSRLEVPGLTGLTSYSLWSYTAEPAAGKTLYRNGTSLQNRAGAGAFNTHASHRFNLGGHTSGTGGYEGDITEIAIFTVHVNQAERLIIDNYLAAKYNLTLAAGDMYAFDGADVYDYDVAGVGRANNGYHNDSRGTGVVRVWNPSDMIAGEFLLWGHNNSTLTTTTTTVGLAGVDGTVIKERLTRIWKVDKTGDVGTVSISFDISALTSSVALGSNLRLLIDRDLDGFGDNDVTPIAGSFSNNVVVFSGVSFNDGDLFTLGNTDSSFPLPIELLSFNAYPADNAVTVEWTTASEINNDFFTVLRSTDGEKWNDMFQLKGAGNSIVRNSYQIIDPQPLSGRSYYRLRQTDFDGETTHSGVVSVSFEQGSELRAWPNPSPGSYSINVAKIAPGQVKVLNTLGQEIPFVLRAEDGVHVDISNQPNGVYLLQVTDERSTRTIRVVKKD